MTDLKKLVRMPMIFSLQLENNEKKRNNNATNSLVHALSIKHTEQYINLTVLHVCISHVHV